jgi:hypothetical protein
MKTKDNPVNNEKFETKVKEVEKVLNKGHLPDSSFISLYIL